MARAQATLVGFVPRVWRPSIRQVMWAAVTWPLLAGVGSLVIMASPGWARWPVSAIAWVVLWALTDREARGLSWGARWSAMALAGAGWWLLSLTLRLLVGDGFGREPAVLFRAISGTVAVVPILAHACATCWATLDAVRGRRR